MLSHSETIEAVCAEVVRKATAVQPGAPASPTAEDDEFVDVVSSSSESDIFPSTSALALADEDKINIPAASELNENLSRFMSVVQAELQRETPPNCVTAAEMEDAHDVSSATNANSTNSFFNSSQCSSQDSSELKCDRLSDEENRPPSMAQPITTGKSEKGPSKAKLKRKQPYGGGDEEELMSRKEKSLGLMCQRFLECMSEEALNGNQIHLETVAKKMEVEKRRIYDIVNVMEALDAMQKTNKSFYRWDGLARLPQLMHMLNREAHCEGLPQRIETVERAMCSFQELTQGRSGSNLNTEITGSGSPVSTDNDRQRKYGKSMKTEIVGTLVDDEVPKSFADSRPCWDPPSNATQNSGEDGNSVVSSLMTSGTPSMASGMALTADRVLRNSLSLLCRRFLMVLLANSNRKVSLDVASTILIQDPESNNFEPPSRSRCRRLYDIANVLVAMGIIKKVHYLFGTKKIPLFVYSGPEPSETALLPLTEPHRLIEKARRDAQYTPNVAQQDRTLTKRSTSLLELSAVAEKEREKLAKCTPNLLAKPEQREASPPSIVLRPKAQFAAVSTTTAAPPPSFIVKPPLSTVTSASTQFRGYSGGHLGGQLLPPLSAAAAAAFGNGGFSPQSRFPQLFPYLAQSSSETPVAGFMPPMLSPLQQAALLWNAHNGGGALPFVSTANFSLPSLQPLTTLWSSISPRVPMTATSSSAVHSPLNLSNRQCGHENDSEMGTNKSRLNVLGNRQLSTLQPATERQNAAKVGDNSAIPTLQCLTSQQKVTGMQLETMMMTAGVKNQMDDGNKEN